MSRTPARRTPPPALPRAAVGALAAASFAIGDPATSADRDGVPDLPDHAAAQPAELDDLVTEAAAHPG